MTPKENQLLFLPLGGCGEIGMNLSLYGHNGKWLMVDCGITFIDEMGMEIAMPDPSFLTTIKNDIVGLVITHGHEDHIGGIAHLWPYFETPIYATPFTAYLIREKLKENGLGQQAKVTEVQVGSTIDLEGFNIQYVPITHSIPEANMLAIKTSAGSVLHTGDWKIDPNPLIGTAPDISAYEQLGIQGIDTLVCDSTNVFETGHSGSEIEVQKSLTELVGLQQNRVAVACFASNVARLHSCYEAAKATGRQVVLAGRSLHRMDKAARYAGYFKNMKSFLTDEALNSLDPSKVLLVCTGSQGEPRSALARIADGSHQRIKLDPGDTIIFSSRIIPGNEDRIHHMYDCFINRGLTLITDDENFTHVSGHPYQDELKKMYGWIKPKNLIAVHGERAHLMKHVMFAKQSGVPNGHAPQNGEVLDISRGNLDLIKNVKTGRWALDGNQLVSLNSNEIKQRTKLNRGGAIFVTLTKNGNKITKDYKITCMGVASESEQQSIQDTVEDTITQALFDLKNESNLKLSRVSDLVRQAICRDLLTLRGKKPHVIVHLS